MRRPDLVIDTYHHIIHRGSRGMDIHHDERDFENTLLLLCYQNDSFYNKNWKRDITRVSEFERPTHWPDVNPLVSIVSFCLHNNHFHLLLKEIREGGVSAFMRRLPNSMSLAHNKKYKGKGSIFQGPYKSRLIESDGDLVNVIFYIMVKNTFERFPGGIEKAKTDFGSAWEWAMNDKFSSLPDYAGKRKYPFVELEPIFTNRFSNERELKDEVKSYLEDRLNLEEQIKELILE